MEGEREEHNFPRIYRASYALILKVFNDERGREIGEKVEWRKEGVRGREGGRKSRTSKRNVDEVRAPVSSSSRPLQRSLIK